MRTGRLNPGLLAWFGVFAAPAAWTLQHVFGLGVTLAACNRAGTAFGIAVNTVTVVLMAAAAATAVAGGVSAVLAFLAMRGTSKDDPPPPGRIFFLSLVGMAISPLFLAIILMSGSGVLSLTLCQQS